MKIPWKNEEVFEAVYKKVLNFLSYKDRTAHELDEAIDKYLFKVHLTVSGKEALKKQLLAEVVALALIDDSAYAKNYLLDVLQTGRLISKKQISNFLYRKGISPTTISDSIDSYYTQDVEERIVSSLFAKKIGQVKGKQGFEKKARITRYLLSKGFSPSVVYTFVDTKIKRY